MSVYLTHEMKCPNCYSDESLHIHYQGTAGLTSEGSEDVGNHEWDDDSHCNCQDCGWSGTVADTKHQADPIETAMCLWEAWLQQFPANMERNGGVKETRQKVAALVDLCHYWHGYALTLGYDTPFDWGWCRFFLEQNVNADGLIERRNPDDMQEAVREHMQ
jgi:hypothetical protein